MVYKRPRSASIEELDDLEDVKPTILITSSSPTSISDNELLKDIQPSLDRFNDSTPPTPKKTKSNIIPKSTPKKKPTSSPTKLELQGGISAKARFAEIIIENGMRGYDKNFVEAETGLTKNQQNEMLKKGRGSLWKALYGFASTL